MADAPHHHLAAWAVNASPGDLGLARPSAYRTVRNGNYLFMFDFHRSQVKDVASALTRRLCKAGEVMDDVERDMTADQSASSPQCGRWG
jgi:hypothetical protein